MHWVSVGIAAVSLVIAFVTLFDRRRGSAKSEGRSDGAMMSELGYIKSGIDDIKTEQREQRQVNTHVEGRLSKVEASAAQAHKRIDRLEEREHQEH